MQLGSRLSYHHSGSGYRSSGRRSVHASGGRGSGHSPFDPMPERRHVASPVGVNGDLVRHGENGLLAADEAGWEQSLRLLASDPELRARLGEAGRRTVDADFSLARGAEMVAKAYGFASPPAD